MKRRSPAPPGPDLFAWVDSPPPPPRVRPILVPRLLLLPDALDADGLPRAALAFPGLPHPTVFPTLAAAVAVLTAMENRR